MAYKRKAQRSRSYSKKRKITRRPRRSNFRRQMRKTFMSMVETKKKEFSYSKFESYHNADPVYCALNGKRQNPDDGTDSTDRIGDEINQLGFKVKLMLYNKYDRPNVTWKVRVCSTPRAFATDGISSSGVFTKSTFYRQITGNCLLDDVEDGMFRTLYVLQRSLINYLKISLCDRRSDEIGRSPILEPHILATTISNIYIHIYIHTYTHTHKHTYTHPHTHIHTYTHIHIHTYIYIYTYIYTHIYIHIYI